MSLTTTAYYTRKSVKWVVLGILLFIISKTAISLGWAYWQKLHPAAPPPPNVIFGKLPAIKFPDQALAKPKETVLETVDSSLPANIPNMEKVYFIPQVGGRFLSLQNTIRLASSAGFNDQPEQISEDVYKFEDKLKNTSLLINVFTGNFSYKYDYINDQTLINPRTLISEEGAVNTTKSFISRLGKMTYELKEGTHLTSYWKITANTIKSVPSPSEADFIRIDLFRKAINKYPVLPPNGNRSSVYAINSAGQLQNEGIVEARAEFFPADVEKYGTYPLINVQQAYAEFNSGNYYLASNDNADETVKVKIRKVYLAYFDPPTPVRFLMPIFVFEGDSNFKAYISAVSTEWVE
jgi:hypothetical protein